LVKDRTLCCSQGYYKGIKRIEAKQQKWQNTIQIVETAIHDQNASESAGDAAWEKTLCQKLHEVVKENVKLGEMLSSEFKWRTDTERDVGHFESQPDGQTLQKLLSKIQEQSVKKSWNNVAIAHRLKLLKLQGEQLPQLLDELAKGFEAEWIKIANKEPVLGEDCKIRQKVFENVAEQKAYCRKYDCKGFVHKNSTGASVFYLKTGHMTRKEFLQNTKEQKDCTLYICPDASEGLVKNDLGHNVKIMR
jgi:hypothetical protein